MKLSEWLCREPISKLILIKWRLQPRHLFLILFVTSFIDDVIIGWMLGYWESDPRVFIGVVDNWSYLVAAFVVYPSIWAFFTWLSPMLVKVFNDISDRGIISVDDEEKYTEVISVLTRILSSLWFQIVAFVSIIVLTAVTIYVTKYTYQPSGWGVIDDWHLWLIVLPRMVFNAYAISYCVLWSLVAVYGLYKVLNSCRLDVFPYHEDNKGGVGFIGRAVSGWSRVIFIIVVFMVTQFWGLLEKGVDLKQLNIILEMAALPIITFAVFLIPFLACRGAMIRAKKHKLKEIAELVEEKYGNVLNNPDPHKKDVDDFMSLRNFRATIIKDFPITPYDMTVIRRLALALIATLLPLLSNILSTAFR